MTILNQLIFLYPFSRLCFELGTFTSQILTVITWEIINPVLRLRKLRNSKLRIFSILNFHVPHWLDTPSPPPDLPSWFSPFQRWRCHSPVAQTKNPGVASPPWFLSHPTSGPAGHPAGSNLHNIARIWSHVQDALTMKCSLTDLSPHTTEQSATIFGSSNRNLLEKIRGMFDWGLTTHFALTTHLLKAQHGRDIHSAVDKTGGARSWGRRRVEEQTLVGSKERPWGEELDISLGWEGVCPCEDREEETPKEQQLRATKWWPLWLEFSDTRGNRKSLLGQDHVGSSQLVRRISILFWEQWQIIRKPQMQTKNDLIYLKYSLVALWRMNSRETGHIRKLLQQLGRDRREDVAHKCSPEFTFTRI